MIDLVFMEGALGVPEEREAFIAYVAWVSSFSLLDEIPLHTRCSCSDRTRLRLMERGVFPFYPKIDSLVRILHVREFAAIDVYRVVTTLTANRLEDVLRIEETETEGFAATYSDGSDALGGEGSELFPFLLAALCLNSHLIDSLICLPAYTPPCRDAVDLSGVVTELLSEYYANVDLPRPCSSVRLKLASSVENIIVRLDPVKMWMSSTDAAFAESVVNISYVMSFASEPDGAIGFSDRILNIPKFSIRDEFLTTSRPLGFMHEPSKIRRLLSSIVDLLAGRNARDGHALREGRGGNAPVRTRGAAIGWRVDIDHEFHLHAWRSADEYEFVCVVHHNDFTLPK